MTDQKRYDLPGGKRLTVEMSTGEAIMVVIVLAVIAIGFLLVALA